MNNFSKFVELFEEEKLDEYEHGVFRVGGSIGQKHDGITQDFGREKGILVKSFPDEKEAQAYAKRRNKQLSPGEKKYYRISYKYALIK